MDKEFGQGNGVGGGWFQTFLPFRLAESTTADPGEEGGPYRSLVRRRSRWTSTLGPITNSWSKLRLAVVFVNL